MFLHSDEINQNPAVVPDHKSYASTNKYGRKVIVFGGSHLGGINRKLFSNSLPKCRKRLKYFSGARTEFLEHYVTPTLNEEKRDIFTIGYNDIDFRQLRYNTVGKDVYSIGQNVERVGF